MDAKEGKLYVNVAILSSIMRQNVTVKKKVAPPHVTYRDNSTLPKSKSTEQVNMSLIIGIDRCSKTILLNVMDL